jgi:hypothetical protein
MGGETSVQEVVNVNEFQTIMDWDVPEKLAFLVKEGHRREINELIKILDSV